MVALDDVRDVFVQVCGLEPAELGAETNLIEDVDIDSIDFMDATYEIDQKYGIKLPVEDWMEEVNAGTEGSKERFVLGNLVREIERLTGTA